MKDKRKCLDDCTCRYLCTFTRDLEDLMEWVELCHSLNYQFEIRGDKLTIDKQKGILYKIAVDAIDIHKYLPNVHPYAAIIDLGIEVFSYEMNGISDAAVMIVDRLPDPMPEWCNELDLNKNYF